MSFVSFVWFTVITLIVLFSVTSCSCFQRKSSDKPTTHYLLCIKWQKDTFIYFNKISLSSHKNAINLHTIYFPKGGLKKTFGDQLPQWNMEVAVAILWQINACLNLTEHQIDSAEKEYTAAWEDSMDILLFFSPPCSKLVPFEIY